MRINKSACLALLAVFLGLSDVHGFVVRCGLTNTWYDDDLEKTLLPSWNTATQGSAQTFPAPAAPGSGPVAVTLAESVIGDDFFGWLGVDIVGLSLGQPVRLELFRVDNDQQIINPQSVLVASFELADGVLVTTGGSRDLNAVEDWDGLRDGKIYTELGFFNGLHAVPGEYVVRVSSPSAAFAAATTGLTIEEIPTDTWFQGRVLDENDNPVPGALVGLLQPVGTGYSELIFTTTADANGDYVLYVPFADEFDVAAVAPGFVAAFASGAAPAIEEGEVIDLDIRMTTATETVAGRVVDAVTHEPVPGLPLTLMKVSTAGLPNGSDFTVGWTDAEGRFAMQVTPGQWGVFFRSSDVSARSYIGQLEGAAALADTTAGDVSGLEIELTPAVSLISGTLEGSDGTPLEQVQVFAFNQESGLAAAAYTFSDGSFTLPAGPGRWEVFAFSYDLEVANYPGTVREPVYFTGANQSIEVGLSARPIAGVLEGYVLDTNGAPLGGMPMLAINIENGVSEMVGQLSYRSSGYFNFFLGAGSWAVYPILDTPAWYGLLVKGLPALTIPEPPAGSPLSLPAQTIQAVTPTTHIELTLRDTNNVPVPGVLMHAFMYNALGEQHDVFAQTNALGVANLPVIAGQWGIHMSTARLRKAGMRELPLLNVPVGSGPVALTATTTAFTGQLPKMTAGTDANGHFLVSGTGEAGRTYDVEGSFNLQQWYPMGRVTAINGGFSILDRLESAYGQYTTAPGNNSGRVFYRVRVQ